MPNSDEQPRPRETHLLEPIAAPALPPLAEAYAAPGARLLVNAVASLMVSAGLVDPIAGGALTAFDSGLVAHLHRISQRRVEVFVDELKRRPIRLTEETMRSEEFLSALRETIEAVAKERREEKVRIFARLFARSAEQGRLGDDRYQEFRQILEDLSYRELQVLLLLHHFETTTLLPYNPEMKEGFLEATEFWPAFCSATQQELGIPLDEMAGVLARLTRTGLYKGFDGMIMGDPGGMGKLTAYFGLFVQWLAEPRE